jgi:DNA-binding transcriptional regulator YiaG
MRAFRKRLGLTQAQAAEMTDTPRRTWEGWEGRFEPPPCLLVLLDYIERFGPLPERQKYE